MAATKTNTKKNASAQSTLDVDAVAERAETKTGFNPIMDLGPKLVPGKWTVTFDESKPRVTEKIFESDNKPRYVIDVQGATILPDGSKGPVENLTLMFPTPYDDGALHSLTNGVLALYKTHQKDLKGVSAIIRKRIGTNRQGAETPFYDVNELHE